MDLVSVVMSVFNEQESWVRKSIESILGQTYVNIEFIIILDNPENKKLETIIREYQAKDKRVRFLINLKNEGLVYSLNKGISQSKGKYIARMDADDYSVPERLAMEYQCIINNQVDLVMSGIDFFYEEKYQKGTEYGEINSEQFADLMKYGNVSIHPTWFFDKEIYNKIQGYRDISCCEDVDFILRALQQGYKCYRMKEHLLYYRLRNSGISKRNSLEQYVKATVLRKAYARGRDIDSLSPIFLVNICEEITDKDKKIFAEADIMMDELVESINAKRAIACFINVFKGLITNKYYRLLFCRNVKFRLKLMECARKEK